MQDVNTFLRCKNGTDLFYHHAELGGSEWAAGEVKRSMFVCFFVILLFDRPSGFWMTKFMRTTWSSMRWNIKIVLTKLFFYIWYCMTREWLWLCGLLCLYATLFFLPGIILLFIMCVGLFEIILWRKAHAPEPRFENVVEITVFPRTFAPERRQYIAYRSGWNWAHKCAQNV